MSTIKSLNDLESIYGKPLDRALWKEIDHINPHYQAFIERSPFLILSTIGEKGLDCSPRGDPPGFVRVVNEKCIQLPDRRGNNRLDSLRNIILNPSVGIIFLIPGIGETIRLSGQAMIKSDEDLCQSFMQNGKAASSVLSIQVEKVYFQCQKALARSLLWSAESSASKQELPSAGEMAKVFADSKNIDFDAEAYDQNYPAYMKETIY
ncbi:MAG: PPOX class probable FMN-dependent enzyme [Candidatus Azotimanducaceae bacterium]|jgi:PPOX class probable FMN-dependent enzyme